MVQRWSRAIGECLSHTDFVCELHFSNDSIIKEDRIKMPDGTIEVIRHFRHTLIADAMPIAVHNKENGIQPEQNIPCDQLAGPSHGSVAICNDAVVHQVPTTCHDFLTPTEVNGDHTIEVKPTGDAHDNEEEATGDDVFFDPIITLPLIEVSNNEEDETEMIKLRAKLYRYDSSCSPAEWKERGTGEVKLLRHKTKHTVRVVMRRDKTLKICANHFVTPWMELKPNCGSDRAWVWSVLADFADEHLTSELLAIRFANAENAQLWKEAFEKAKKIVGTECEIYAGKSNPEDKDDESDSDTCSYATYSDSSEKEENEKASSKSETVVDNVEKPNDKSTDEVTEVFKELDVGTNNEKDEETK